MSVHRVLFERINLTVERAGVARLIVATLVSVWPVITAALSGSEGPFSEEIHHVCDESNVEASFDVPGLSVGARLIKLRSCALCDLFFCSALLNVFDFPLKFFCWSVSPFTLSLYCSAMSLIPLLFPAQLLTSFVSNFVISTPRCLLQ